ncbi:hypothetical protein [Mucilaginibacter paludis]|nr:hypothetical protein [Mucilaginibacter paludis]
MTNSIIAIKGSHLDKQIEIFKEFNYVDVQQDEQFDNLNDMYDYLFDNYFNFSERDVVLRGIWFDNDWTIICDPEMINVWDGPALLKLSDKVKSDVMTFLIQTTSGSFGFTKCGLSGQRNFLSINGSVTENTGLPLPEESGLNINEQIFTDDIISLADKFGINFEKTAPQSCLAKKLNYTEELKRELTTFKSDRVKVPTQKKHTWWKFW